MRKLTEKIPKDILDMINNDPNNEQWDYIAEIYILTEDFIRENSDKLNWVDISVYQKLSEDFIMEFKDKVFWDDIAVYQRLSEEFLIKNKDKIHFVEIRQNKRLNTFSKEFQDLIFASIMDDLSSMCYMNYINFTDIDDWYLQYMTDYMKDKYNKLSMFL